MLNRPFLMALFGAVVVALAIGLNYYPLDEEAEEPKTAQEATKTDGPDEEAETATSVKPSFDVVRINPQGDTVMAGRATPGAEVTITDGDEKIGEVTADKRGEWVFVPPKPLPPGNRQLTLESTGPDGAKEKSDSVVVLAVPEKNKDVSGRASERPSRALALQVPRSGAGASRVLQKPDIEGDVPVAIDTIDYDDLGKLAVSGRTAPGTRIRLYLDNSFIGEAVADGRGQWSIAPDSQVSPGLYTLRADQVDDGGKVVARVSIPFARSEPLTGLAPGSVAIVQPGNSLWRLARATYGEGTRYTLIYEANKDQIKDPDLIYPGQLFALPKSR